MFREIIDERAMYTIKISKDVFTVLQYFVEQETIKMLRNSNFASIHAGRVKLTANDIKFARALEKKENPYENLENKTCNQKKEGKKEEKLQIMLQAI